VNLACKAVLLAITSAHFAETGECEENFFEYLDKDPIAVLYPPRVIPYGIHGMEGGG